MAKDFYKAKLTEENLDKFAIKYAQKRNDSISYTTKSGETISLSPTYLIKNLGALEYKYFLGQTLPYHNTELNDSFDIMQLAYIVRENKNVEQWTKNPKVLNQFIQLGNKMRFLQLYMDENIIKSRNYDIVTPVIHKEDEKEHDPLMK